jgi:hypothetical protein
MTFASVLKTSPFPKAKTAPGIQIINRIIRKEITVPWTLTGVINRFFTLFADRNHSRRNIKELSNALADGPPRGTTQEIGFSCVRHVEICWALNRPAL